MTAQEPLKRAGFAAILGVPNAGKSTLVNQLVGEKVAIVTHKVQTTRFPIRGIAHHGDAQIVLVDTPGLFTARRRLDRAMVQAAWSRAADADCCVHLVDATHWAGTRQTGAETTAPDADLSVTRTLKERSMHAMLALNKVDLLDHALVLPIIDRLAGEGAYDAVVPISAKNGEGLESLLDLLAARMPEGPPLYPPDQVADLPSRLWAAELTREALMLRLHQELPYQLTVETESWEDRRDGSVRLQQVITVARSGHKAIVLGKGGRVLKEIGSQSRRTIADALGRPVHLFLFVKVDPKWQERRERYEGLGLDFEV